MVADVGLGFAVSRDLKCTARTGGNDALAEQPAPSHWVLPRLRLVLHLLGLAALPHHVTVPPLACRVAFLPTIFDRTLGYPGECPSTNPLRTIRIETF